MFKPRFLHISFFCGEKLILKKYCFPVIFIKFSFPRLFLWFQFFDGKNLFLSRHLGIFRCFDRKNFCLSRHLGKFRHFDRKNLSLAAILAYFAILRGKRDFLKKYIFYLVLHDFYKNYIFALFSLFSRGNWGGNWEEITFFILCGVIFLKQLPVILF